MARTLRIDAELWSQDWFSRMTAHEKILYFGLLAHASEQGEVEADPAYLKVSIFPYSSLGPSELRALRANILDKPPGFKFRRDPGGHEWVSFDWSSTLFVRKDEPIEHAETDAEPTN